MTVTTGLFAALTLSAMLTASRCDAVELVKEFKCLYKAEVLNCSWIPVALYPNLELSDRACVSDPNNKESLKACDRPYSTGTRNGCYWHVAQGWKNAEICIYIKSEIGWQYFKPTIEYQLAPPTNLSYVWINKFAVEMSWDWERPESLPNDCKISYELVLEQPYKKTTKKHLDLKRHVMHCITENGDTDRCTFTVHAMFNEETCNGPSRSADVTETARREEPRVELVKDFKCLYTTEGFNCSWIPLYPYLNLEISYRACASDPNNNKSLKPCDRPYGTGERKGCYWPSLGQAQVLDDPEICVYIESEIGWHYFKPIIGPASPVLTITEDNNHLKLTWSSPEFQNDCIWIYEFCYTECDKSKQCRTHNHEVSDQNETLSPQNEMLYNRDCRYDFRSRLKTSGNCPELVSDWSEIVTHGANKTPDQTLPLVAIIIPIILFVCILLACYCFRRHSDIICPNIPDPSAIFKEMVNGKQEHNKAEQKPIENVYTPMPEDVESCKVTLINQSGALQPNS